MDFVINHDTGDSSFFHGSRVGIQGRISPNSNIGKTDFGNAFYIGTKRTQALLRVTNEYEPVIYEVKIPKECLNKDNTLQLGKDDWVYFVLYNRGLLEDIKDSSFYKYYAHLADGKDFIVGPIADDVYDRCIQDFKENNITDYVFKELIDSFQYGTQIAVKSQKACDSIILVKKHILTKNDRKQVLEKRMMNKRQRFEYYNKRKAFLNTERKGKYLSEIKAEIMSKTKDKEIFSKENIAKKYKNLSFPKKIFERKDSNHEIFR